MNKFTFALALGAGLVSSLAVPDVQADVIQTLTPATMSASTFNSLYAPSTTVMSSGFTFMNTPNAGMVESQVFTGAAGTAAAGTYAYAYQFDVNNATDTSTTQTTSVNSASMLFNATPLATYVVTDGSVGGISPSQAPTGSMIQTPTSIAWLPNSTTGSLTFQYLNPTTNTSPLHPGAMSGTIVVISNQPPGNSVYVSLQNPEPQTTYPTAYSPKSGSISESPAPEPATILAWGSVLAALAVGHRYRRNRASA
jgi:hypothetical protein